MNITVATLNAKYIHTCLALRYLKAYAEPEYSVRMAEYTIKDPTIYIVTDLYEQKPDVVGFSCYIWNIEETIKVVQALKKVLPQVTILLGGPEVSFDVEHWLQRIPEADYIIIGEGEQTFKELLRGLDGKRDLASLTGIGYRVQGEPMVKPPTSKLDLSTIPSPYRFPEDVAQLPQRITYVETSRGCPFSCQFCLSSTEVGVRYFPLEMMKEELLFLIQNGARTIKFLDRTFNINRDYAMEMFKFLVENHQGCIFQFEITADILRPEIIDYLTENAPPGIFRFEIGVQSTNERTNELVQRRQNFAKLTNTVMRIKESGRVVQHLDLIAGLPEEDYASLRKTFNDVFAFEPEELQLGFLKMLRGTGLRNQAEQYGYRYMEHAPYEMLENDILSFGDVVRIKRVEEMLEKYWNLHFMDTTILYLTQVEFPSPFDFFQELGDYWEANGWGRIGHQLEDLYQRLEQFLMTRKTQHPEVWHGLMKYDYFIHYKQKPRKTWWEFSMSKGEQSALLQLLADKPALLSPEFAQYQLTEEQLHKHTMVERLPFNLAKYLESGQVEMAPTLLLVYYDPKNPQARPFIQNMLMLVTE
ncbi:B12-binding domain-containing radical SAM protein [Rubeoparvulum massiliense]|uniref:B12-binding domain-containing radical SAM protein n=1 Tax=Rubeoparvulum massiliense TaxID=1631346 RepID=UPI000A6AC2E2|nr:B12-binding domain-containing radical SAM protein [Rubeoparvulum massiliense]